MIYYEEKYFYCQMFVHYYITYYFNKYLHNIGSWNQNCRWIFLIICYIGIKKNPYTAEITK